MKSRAFTLIELLVVISIVALLSSVVLASLNTAREKARIKGAAYFAAQTNHITGDQTVGAWNFDECSGTSLGDVSGSSNAATLGSGASFTSDTPSGSGCAASFVGTGIMSVPTYASLAPNDSDFTLSFWIKTTGVGDVIQNSGGGNAGTFTSGYALALQTGAWSGCTKNGQMFFAMSNGTTREGSYCSKTALNDGKWHLFTLVVNRGSSVTMYVDGAVDKQGSTSLTGSITPTSFRVGGPVAWQSAFTGLVDDVQISLKGLTAFEVEDLYASRRAEFAATERSSSR